MMWRLTRALLILAGLYAVLAGYLGLLIVVILADALLFSGAEVVVYGVAYDLLWTTAPLHAIPWASACALAMLWASEPVRREILAR